MCFPNIFELSLIRPLDVSSHHACLLIGPPKICPPLSCCEPYALQVALEMFSHKVAAQLHLSNMSDVQCQRVPPKNVLKCSRERRTSTNKDHPNAVSSTVRV